MVAESPVLGTTLTATRSGGCSGAMSRDGDDGVDRRPPPSPTGGGASHLSQASAVTAVLPPTAGRPAIAAVGSGLVGEGGNGPPPPGPPPTPPPMASEWTQPARSAALPTTATPTEPSGTIPSGTSTATVPLTEQVCPAIIGSSSVGPGSGLPAVVEASPRWARTVEEVRVVPPPQFDDESAPLLPSLRLPLDTRPYLLDLPLVASSSEASASTAALACITSGRLMNVEAMREEGYPDGEDVVVLSPPYFDGPRLDVAHAAAPRDRRAPTQPDPWVAGPARSSVRRVREIASLLPARDPTGLPPVPVTDVAAAAAVVLPATPSGSLSRLGRQSTVLPPPWTSAESVYSTASESPGPLVRRTTGRQSSSPGGSPVPGGCYLSDFEGSSAGDSRTVRVGSTGGLGHVDSVASSSSDSDGEHGVSLAARYKAAVLDAEELAVDARAAEAEAELEKAKASLRENLYVLAVILFFAVSSLSAIFINKSCLSGYGFNFPFTLLMGQMIFSLLTLSLMDLLGPARLPVLTRSQQLRVLLPTLLFIANVVVGLSALSLVNIPMFSAFRRLTLLFVMAAEYIMLNKRYSRSLIAAVVTMTVGAFVSALDDGTFSGLGYALVFINNVLTAAYLASIKRVMVEIDMSPLVLLYYTALLGLPFIAILLPASGELRNVIEAFSTRPDLWSFGFGVSVLLMAASAFLVNFSTSLCTDITTPLTTSVAGQVKNVLQTVLGFFSWGYVFSPINAVGLVLALMGQCWFAWIKYSQRHLPVGPTAGGFPVVDGDGAVATTGAKSLLLSREEEEGSGRLLSPPQGRRPAPVSAVV